MRTQILLPLLSILAIAGCGGTKDGKAELPPPPGEGAQPEPPDAAKTPAAGESAPMSGPAGTLEARRRSTLSPRASGVVTKVHVRDGDRVAEGDALVSLDTEDFALRTRQAQAAVDGARAGFAAAEADWKRSKALLADKAVPEAQYEAMDARYQGAKAGLAQADVALAMARKAERDSVLRAPYAGVVVRRYVSEGEYASVMPATNLVTLEETGVYDLRVYLPADRAGAIHTKDSVTVRLPGVSNDVRGTVLQVLPPIDENGTVAVLVEVPDAEGALRPGMTAEAVSIKSEKKP